MEWTTEVPTKMGYYWACVRADARDTGVYIVKVVHAFNELVATIPGKGYKQYLESFTHWMGPLDIPEAPKEG